MDNILYNFLTIEEVREKRPGLSLYEDWQVQEALNMTMDLLDSECNGLILRVIQFSLSRDVKDETNPLFRTTQELEYLKRAFIAQTQFTINLKNDQTVGNNSLSMGGISMSSSRSNNFNQVAPGVYENLQRARVYKMNDAFKGNGNVDRRVTCLEKIFLTREEASEYVRYYQPEAAENSILVVNGSHLIRPMRTQDIEWKTKKADTILDRDNEYKNIWDISNLAFFGNNGTDAMTRQETYNSIWNSMFYNPSVVYPNEAIVRLYDSKTNLVYTFKSNQDGNQGHNPLFDNENEFWWKKVQVADNINYEDVADLVINSKEFLKKIVDIKNEFDNTLDAFWNQIKDNEHLLRKFEELYDQTVTENNQLEQKLDTKIEANTTLINNLDRNNIAYKNQHNNFTNNQTITGDTAFIQFKKGTARKGYIGKAGANSDNIVLHSENGDLILKASQNVRLEVGARNGVIGERAPTANNHLTNKKYVDDKIRQEINNSQLNGIDLAPYALKAQDNKFVNQTINDNTPYITFINEGEGETYGRVGNETISNSNFVVSALLRDLELKAKGKVICSQTPTEDNDIVNKGYLDGIFNQLYPNLKKYVSVEFTSEINLFKQDIKSGLYAYKIFDQTYTFTTGISGVDSSYGGEQFLYKITVLEYGSNVFVGQINKNGSGRFTSSGGVQVTTNSQSNWTISGTDLRPGAAGSFRSRVKFLLEIFY